MTPNKAKYISTTKIGVVWLNIPEYIRAVVPILSGLILGMNNGPSMYIPNATSPYHQLAAKKKHSRQNIGTAIVLTIPNNVPILDVKGVVDAIMRYAINNQIHVSILYLHCFLLY